MCTIQSFHSYGKACLHLSAYPAISSQYSSCFDSFTHLYAAPMQRAFYDLYFQMWLNGWLADEAFLAAVFGLHSKLMTSGPTRTSNTALHVDLYSRLFRKTNQTRWIHCRRVHGAPVFESFSNTAPFIFQRLDINNAQKPVRRNLMMPFW